MINAQVEATINILKQTPGMPLLRLAQVEGYIEKLERENYILNFFQERIIEVVKDFTEDDEE